MSMVRRRELVGAANSCLCPPVSSRSLEDNVARQVAMGCKAGPADAERAPGPIAFHERRGHRRRHTYTARQVMRCQHLMWVSGARE